MANPYILSLVRHARTKGNRERRYVGWTDEPIIAEALPVIDAQQTKVYGSDLQRCQQTASYYYPNAKFIGLPELRESNFGQYEMATYEQLKEDDHYRQWIDDPENKSPPNGETVAMLKIRVLRGLQKIEYAPSSDIVLHGGSIRAILVQLAPEPSQFWDWQIGHDERYLLSFASFEQFKEGRRCTSLSVEPIMASDTM